MVTGGQRFRGDGQHNGAYILKVPESTENVAVRRCQAGIDYRSGSELKCDLAAYSRVVRGASGRAQRLKTMRLID